MFQVYRVINGQAINHGQQRLRQHARHQARMTLWPLFTKQSKWQRHSTFKDVATWIKKGN